MRRNLHEKRGKWNRVNKKNPCPVCKKPDFCLVSPDGAIAGCMRVESGSYRTKQTKNGAPMHLHRLLAQPQNSAEPAPKNGAKTRRAASDVLNQVYSALLKALPLKKTHRERLRERGLPAKTIKRNGYGSLPVQGRHRIAKELHDRFGNAILSIPGFIFKEKDGGRYLTIAGAPGLLVPVREIGGNIVALKVRRDDVDEGSRYSYISSTTYAGPGPGAPVHIPLGIKGPTDTVRISEGELKADVAYFRCKVPTISAPGVTNWRSTLDTLKTLAAKTARLAFDMDARTKPTVAGPLLACAEAVLSEGLNLELERWPLEAGKGIDDLLSAGKSPEVLSGDAALTAIREIAVAAGVKSREENVLERMADVLATGGAPAVFADRPLLEALARLKSSDPAAFAARRAAIKGQISLRDLDAALKPLQRQQANERPPALLGEAGYRIQDGRLCRECGTPDGGMALVPLCNFTAQICEVITRDDGVELVSQFVLDGTLADGRPLPPVQVPTADFAGLDWVTPLWHGEAVVYAGMGMHDHARVAIELLSQNRTRRTIFTHTGWREIAGVWHYLHGGGAIGPAGTAPDIEVSLPGALARYTMPPPPEEAELIAAVRASLALLDGLAPDQLAFPLQGAVFRAALGTAPGALDLSVHLAGPHGAGKSELVALAVQHYGAGMDARNLPGSWLSTGNALEGLAFAAKDALFVVDDYAPRGTSGDRQRLEREADRLLRAQGNRAGRQRMRADGGIRPERPPRGLILSTGEDVPGGQSLRGRLLILDASPGDVPLARLTSYQRDASAGLYAKAMAGFVRWLAPHYGELCVRLPDERAALRDKALTGAGSPRTPGIVADLALGLKLFFDFACSIKACTDAERDTFACRGWQALLKAADAHAKHVEAAEPTALFLRLLLAALASGRAHVADREGRVPEAAQAWGWREENSDDPGWRPQGRRIGWLEGTDLYLEPEASFAAAQEMARDQNEAIPVSSRTLHQRLKELGLLASWDSRRQRLTVRRTLAGVERREVLHLDAGPLSGGIRPSRPSTSPAIPEENPEIMNGFSGRSSGRSNGLAAQPSTPPSTATVEKEAENLPGGRSGRSCTGVEAKPDDDSELL